MPARGARASWIGSTSAFRSKSPKNKRIISCRSDLELFSAGRFPVWIWMDDPSFYGFPLFGEPAVKVTQDAGGKTVDPDTRTFEPDPRDRERVTRAFLRRASAGGARSGTSREDVPVHAHPRPGFRHRHVAEPPQRLASQSAPAMRSSSLPRSDNQLAGLALEDEASLLLERFAVDRPILKMAQPPRTYMV